MFWFFHSSRLFKLWESSLWDLVLAFAGLFLWKKSPFLGRSLAVPLCSGESWPPAVTISGPAAHPSQISWSPSSMGSRSCSCPTFQAERFDFLWHCHVKLDTEPELAWWAPLGQQWQGEMPWMLFVLFELRLRGVLIETCTKSHQKCVVGQCPTLGFLFWLGFFNIMAWYPGHGSSLCSCPSWGCGWSSLVVAFPLRISVQRVPILPSRPFYPSALQVLFSVVTPWERGGDPDWAPSQGRWEWDWSLAQHSIRASF